MGMGKDRLKEALGRATPLAASLATRPQRGFQKTRRALVVLAVSLFLGTLAFALTSHSVGLYFDGSSETGGTDSMTVPYGGTAIMTAWFQDGTGVIRDEAGATAFSPVVPGTAYTTGALSVDHDKTYTLTVTNPAGDAVTAQVSVTVTQITVAPISPASPHVTAGSSVNFTSSALGGVNSALVWTSSGGSFGSTNANGNSTSWTAPATPGTYNITTNSVADPSKSASTQATVDLAPVASSLAASAVGPVYGTSFTLTPVFSNGSGAIDHGVACPQTGTASTAITANWTGERTFTLTVTNPAGMTATASVTVTPVLPVSVTSLVATPAQVNYGGVSTLSWALSGVPDVLTLNGTSVLGQNSASASPARRQSYTLTGNNGYGGASRTVTVAARGLDLVAGSMGGAGYLEGRGAASRLYLPQGVAMDPAGNLFVADTNNNVIRKVDTSGNVTTLAGGGGTGSTGSGYIDDTGAAAAFNTPQGVAVDASGNVYVADTYNNKIRKIDISGNVTTLASGFGFSWPAGVAVDSLGNIYVADTGSNVIRSIDTFGSVATIAGSGYTGSSDGQGTAASFNTPQGIAVDASGNLYVADSTNSAIRKIDTSGNVTTLAGAGTSGFLNGQGTAARFSNPQGVAVDASGNVYVADSTNGAIRKVDTSANVTTLAGGGGRGSSDGQGVAAKFWNPQSVVVGLSGSIYVADTSNNTIRKIDSSGNVTTTAGEAATSGSTDGQGAGASFTVPTAVAVGASGSIYVVDTGNAAIRKIDPMGAVTTFASGFSSPTGVAVGASGYVYVADSDDNAIYRVGAFGTRTALAGQYSYVPNGVALDSSSNVYVADQANQTVWKIGATGTVTALAGQGQYAPSAVAVDASGNVYVADTDNYAIQKVDTAGNVTILAGQYYYVPSGVAVDASGNVYVVDRLDHTVWRIDPAGNVLALLVEPGATQYGLATGLLADGAPPPLPGGYGSLSQPTGIAVTTDGDLVITDGNAVMQITAPLLDGVSTVSPTGSVAAGSSVLFSVVTGGNTTTVTWSSTAGAWSGSTWTAPITSGTYTITATSVQDPTKSSTTTVTVP